MTINKVMSLATRDFADAVRWAAKTSGGQIRFDVGKEDTSLYLSSFQDTNSSRAKIDMTLTSGNPGERTFVVSSSMLVNSLKLMKGTDFIATLSSSTLTLKSGRSTVNLPIIKGGDEIIVPPLPPLAGRVEAYAFKKAVSNVILAAASDDSAVVLMTVHCIFSPKNGMITMVATDRYKIMIRSVAYIPADDSIEDYSKNVQASSLKTLIAGLQNPDSTVDLHLTPSGSQFVLRDVNYMSGVGTVDDEFLKYEGFLKATFARKIKVELSELKAAIDGIATLLTGEEAITLRFTEDECVVSSASNVGSTVCAVEAVLAEVEAVDGEEPVPAELLVGFGPRNIRPVLNSVSSKFIELHYNDATLQKPTGPWHIKELDDDGNPIASSFTIVMPVRL